MRIQRLQRHAGQRLFCQGEQLRRVEGQFATDHLLRNFLDQRQQLLAPSQLNPLRKAAQLAIDGVQRRTGLIEGLAPLRPPLCQPLLQALLQAAVVALLATLRLALVETFLIALLHAFLKAVGDCPLQGNRVVFPFRGQPLRQGRKTVGPPVTGLAFEYFDRHCAPLTLRSVHGTVAPRGHLRSPSAAPPP